MTRTLVIVLLSFGLVQGQLSTDVSSKEVIEKTTTILPQTSSLEVIDSKQKKGEIELEIVKPYSISKEQFVRPSKIGNQKDLRLQQSKENSTEENTKFRLSALSRNEPFGNPERLSDVTAEDILPILPRNLTSFVPILQHLNGEKCQKHAEYFVRSLHNLTKWAVQMFDAATKIPEGVLYGSSYHFGNFDECLDVEAVVPAASTSSGEAELLTGKYCLASVVLSGLRQDQVQASPVDFTQTAWDSLKVPQHRGRHRKDKIHWSFCVPAACSHEDVELFLNGAIDLSNIKGLTLDFKVKADMCQVKKEAVWDEYDIALGVVFAIFLLTVGVATAIDIFTVKPSHNASNLYLQSFLCFSAYSNVAKLARYTPSPYNLDCIFGIKAITMTLILMGHATAFLFGGPSMNSNYKEEALLKVENGILLNNPLLVDTFLMIGAFLLCRLLLVELEKRKFINPLILYAARFIRLTPAYAIVIAIYCTWFNKMGSGPLWESKIELERERCRSSWWTNVLYINNYVNSEQLCMFQSWYLAVDTQFFILAPAIIYPLWRWRGIGEIILGLSTIVSIAIPFAVTYLNHLDPVLMLYSQEISDLSSNPMYQTSYIKTHMRGMSYMIGLLLGYVVHRVQSSGYKVPKAVIWGGWIIGSFTSISAMFTVAIFYRRPYDQFEAASYAALHRVGWCLGIAWVIFACVTNNAGKLDSFLKWRPWTVFSRLSYCSYLVNGLVELHSIGTLSHTIKLSNMSIAHATISHIIFTYALAFFFSIIFEAPILGIESLLLKNASKSQRQEENKSNQSLSTNSSDISNSLQEKV